MTRSELNEICHLGLDLGSVNVRAVLLTPTAGAAPEMLWQGERPIRGRLFAALAELLDDLPAERPVRARVTGAGRRLLEGQLAVPPQNEIIALGEAARWLCPEARAVIEIGGHTSRWVALDGLGAVADYALNEQCAAGSGVFIEQQAARLHLDVVALSAAALAARRGAPVAGRCSVFAKSDMIHLQQKGIPAEEIAYGLCLAVARNFVATLLRGRICPAPVALVGGGALNGGLARAFAQVLGQRELLAPPHAPFFPAIGTALTVEPNQSVLAVGELVQRVRALAGPQVAAVPLPRLAINAPQRRDEQDEPRYRTEAHGQTLEAYLGVDVGSVSTNLVVIDEATSVLDGIYLPTRGRPLEVLQEGLGLLRERFGDALHVRALGTTGSGRHLAAALLGADLVQNEITCQLRSAVHYVPDVDTVIEIGGQDSKFIRAAQGRIVDFAMNRICAAGTGSFLEEEAVRLGVSVEEDFADLALAAQRPANLGCRCTVFMDTEVVNAQSREVTVPDLCAGLAYAIARNYLDRVVEGRSLGQHVVMQGGVASNASVVAAFRQLLGRDVHVHPHNRISGAIGAALIARERQRGESTFRGLALFEQQPRVRTFECLRCENRCQVSQVSVSRSGAARPGAGAELPRPSTSGAARSDAGALERPFAPPLPPHPTPTGQIRAELPRPTTRTRAHFGDACERFSARDRVRSDSVDLPDLFAEREALVRAALRPGLTGERPRATIGIPWASFLHEQLPFWATLLGELGFAVRVSSPSSTRTLEVGSAHLPAETCLPVKLTFGHVQELVDGGVDAVFVPSLVEITDWRGGSAKFCPYVQSLPFMLAAGIDGPMLTPELELGDDLDRMVPELLRALGPLGARPGELRDALRVAAAAQRGFLVRLRSRGAEVLGVVGAARKSPGPVRPFQGLTPAGEHPVKLAILGKPYNLVDPFLNMNLGRHLRRLGALAVPIDFFPDETLLDPRWGRVPWRYSQDLLRALQILRERSELAPVMVSNYGCGPDAFIGKHTARLLQGRPHLELEFDEHRAEAGLITRLEAFLDELAHGTPERTRLPAPALRPAAPMDRRRYVGRRIFVPYFSDHVHAMAGALRSVGLDGRILPEPDHELIQRAERCSTGRECHAYSMIAADLDRLIDQHTPGDIFLMPGSTIPCLIQQYGVALQLLLEERQAVETIDVLSPNMEGWKDLLGYEGVFRLYRGLLAVDLLLRSACAVRPYERQPGAVDAVYAESLQDLQDAIAACQIEPALRRCAERLESVPVEPGPRRPLVGIAGDIYTRINHSVNQRLFWQLEALGCEVRPSPFLVDLTNYGLVEQLLYAWRERQSLLPRNGVALLWQRLAAWEVERRLGSWDEPARERALKMAEPYIGRSNMVLLEWNVAKMVDFARRGASGILNVVAQNCMVGTISGAITRRIRDDHGGIPLVTLVFGATESDAQQTSLEAFVHQVRRFAARSSSGARPALEA